MERLDGVVRWRSIRPARSRPSPPPRGRRHGAPSKRTTMNQNDTAVATDSAQEDASFLLTPPPTATTMRVNTRGSDSEPFDPNKTVRAGQSGAEGQHAVDPMRVANSPLTGLYDGASTHDLDGHTRRPANGKRA